MIHPLNGRLPSLFRSIATVALVSWALTVPARGQAEGPPPPPPLPPENSLVDPTTFTVSEPLPSELLPSELLPLEPLPLEPLPLEPSPGQSSPTQLWSTQPLPPQIPAMDLPADILSPQESLTSPLPSIAPPVGPFDGFAAPVLFGESPSYGDSAERLRREAESKAVELLRPLQQRGHFAPRGYSEEGRRDQQIRELEEYLRLKREAEDLRWIEAEEMAASEGDGNR